MKSFAQCLKGMWQANTRSHCPRIESEHEPTLIQKCCEHVSDHNSSVVQVLASQCQFLGFVLGFGQILCLLSLLPSLMTSSITVEEISNSLLLHK